MNLDRQLQSLIDEAPQYGVPSPVMAQGVIPVLKLLAQQLQHLDYYVMQTEDGNWIVTTLLHREKPQPAKKVIYAFATRQDAASFQGISQKQIQMQTTPVTHLLFELFALNQVDSIVFMDTPGNVEQGKEIQRKMLQDLIQQKLKSLKPPEVRPSTSIPPHWA